MPNSAETLAAVPVYSYPLNPSLPLELDDGTRCELIARSEYDRNVISVRVFGSYDRSSPTAYERGEGHEWSYYLDSGLWCGSREGAYPRLRNVDPAAAKAALVGKPESVPAVATRFEVRSGLNGTNRDEWSCVSEFDNGKDAADWVKTNRETYGAAGKSLAIVKVEPNPEAANWREREAMRLTDGTYTPLPGSWGSYVAREYPDHFAHIASSDKRKVAFTETVASGERDKQKVLSAAAYVERFFGDGAAAWMSYGSRSSFIADMLGSSTTPLFAPLGDREAIKRVYRDCGRDGYGVTSCMTHPPSDYACHPEVYPVEVYAMGGDITVAILRGHSTYPDKRPDDMSAYEYDSEATWDGDGPIIARCLVWPEKKEFGRLYGQEQLLKTALEAQGFKRASLYGARMGKVPIASRGPNAYAMPYLDIGDCSFNDDEGDDFFRVGGSIQYARTDGIAYLEELATCESCDSEVSDDDTHSVRTSRHEHQTWCTSCYENNTFYCEHLEETVADSCARSYEDSHGNRAYVADWALERGDVEGVYLCTDGVWRENAFGCADCSEVFAEDDLNVWDETETGNDNHSEGDSLCDCCHSSRVEMATEFEAEAEAEREAEALASPELPLEQAEAA